MRRASRRVVYYSKWCATATATVRCRGKQIQQKRAVLDEVVFCPIFPIVRFRKAGNRDSQLKIESKVSKH